MRKVQTIAKVATPAPDALRLKESLLDAEEARRQLRYDPTSGYLYWKVKKQGCRYGSPVGTLRKQPKKDYYYVNVYINGKLYRAHRLIWLIVTGNWPTVEIDHVDRDGTNNSWGNLRPATHLQNGANISLKKNNTSGYAGISFDKRRGKFRSRVMIKGSEIWLGYFNTVEEALEVRNLAVLKYHGQFGVLQ